MKFNWETFVLALVQAAPSIISLIRTILPDSTPDVHNAVASAIGASVALVSGSTIEQSQSAGTVVSTIHALATPASPTA